MERRNRRETLIPRNYVKLRHLLRNSAFRLVFLGLAIDMRHGHPILILPSKLSVDVDESWIVFLTALITL